MDRLSGDLSRFVGRQEQDHVGDVHACEAFRAAAPRRVQRDGATLGPRVRGESYKVDVYEAAIGKAFEHVAVSSRLKVDTVALAKQPEGGDVLLQARITLTAAAKARGWDAAFGPRCIAKS